MFSGFIFDLDGTLVNSTLNFQEIKRAVGCPSNQDLLSYAEQLEPVNKRKVIQTIEHYELEDAKNSQILPGAKEFLAWLRQLSIPSALVTRNSPKATELKLTQNKLSFDIVLTREDSLPKPAPDALLRILNEWQFTGEQTVYIGDYLYDIQAARNAKMNSYLYAPEIIPQYATMADLTFNCWHDLLERISAN
ncbi:MAG: HAD-IA family hydrolase [Gammaproteobacteria bacterium]|nr:HAD-IA family hydrolase [Gammaproteobacteria bacterium]